MNFYDVNPQRVRAILQFEKIYNRDWKKKNVRMYLYLYNML